MLNLSHQHRAGFVALDRALQRHRLGQWLVGNQHASGVGADVADYALQVPGAVHQFFDRLVGVVRRLEIGA